ncbi:MAG: hypothetical protein GKC08_02785 [Methanosarcinales archaeon]|nr:hypothetical protein [Methanosarcinales archaeon]
MTDVMLLWDNPLLFEKLFKENDLKCQRILSTALGTPFLPACKCVIIPTGFANSAYTKILPGIERNGKAFEKFVSAGGVLVVFGALVTKYDHSWLPMQLTYIEKHGETHLHREGVHDAQCIVDDPGLAVECDGYFSAADGDVILKNDDDQAVMVVKKVGAGMIIATSVHEFPSPGFLGCITDNARRSKI